MQWAKQKEYGFTIVELLIVIVVIAILAAITVVAYNGIQNRAYDTTVQSDLRSIAQRMETYKIDPALSPSEFYPGVSSEISAAKLKITSSAYLTGAGNNFLYCRGSDTTAPKQWAIIVKSKSGKTFYVSYETGVKEYTATVFPASQNDICPPAGVAGTGKGLWGYDSSNWTSWSGAS